MLMSLKDALLYPIRGNNIWKFLVFALVYIVFSITTPTDLVQVVSILVGIFTAAYFWSCLEALASGYNELPGFMAALSNWRRGIGIQIMGLVYAIPIGLLVSFALAFIPSPLIYLVYLGYALIFYLVVAIAIVRYVYEEKATVVYSFVENIRVLVQNWRISLSLLGALTIVAIFVIGVIAILTIGTVLVFQPSNAPDTDTSVAMALGGAMLVMFLYGCFVNTYLWYSFGLTLGYFSADTAYSKATKLKMRSAQETDKADASGKQLVY